MTKKYIAGQYAIKYKGRGLVYAKLTAGQAKTLFELFRAGKLEIESIDLIK